jgi:CTP-dependent riboflavin kinase
MGTPTGVAEKMYEKIKYPTIRGVVQSGVGKGAYFTQLDWVVEQCRRVLGYTPFPGTLNVRIVDEDLNHLDLFLQGSDFELIPNDPVFCSARVKKVTVNQLPGAVILLPDQVRTYERRVLEIIAACSLKETLGIRDGDLVTIAVL